MNWRKDTFGHYSKDSDGMWVIDDHNRKGWKLYRHNKDSWLDYGVYVTASEAKRCAEWIVMNPNKVKVPLYTGRTNDG